jgi:hypothetical protein
MSIYRTYFDRDTVIVRNSCANTGRNPITELFHGGSLDSDNILYSRYLFGFDLTELIDRVNTKEYSLSGMTHKINVTNTSCFEYELFCKTFDSSCGEACRATAFDLILFEIPEKWAEGNGYDYVASNLVIQKNKQTRVFADLRDQVYCEGPANWEDRLSLTAWSQPGVYNDPYMWYSGNTSGYTGTTIDLVKGEQYFERGDENVCIDVTDYINGLISSGITEANLGLAYKPGLEAAPAEELFYTGFFSRDTQTVYEPYMETIYDDTIKDDRCEFHLDKSNRLYLYVNAGGERVNATVSGVTIYDQNDSVYQTFTSSEINQVTTGVYYIDLSVSTDPVNGYCGNIQFRDVWNGVTVNGRNLGDVELDFVIKDDESYYNIGSGDKSGRGVGNSRNISIYDYHFSFSGIKRKEKIKRGDTRRVDIEATIPFSCDHKPLDKISYRIYIKEGETQLEYIPWMEVNRTEDSNYFLVDTSWFIPNDYYMEFKIESGNEVRTYHDIIQFEIVSEKDWC